MRVNVFKSIIIILIIILFNFFLFNVNGGCSDQKPLERPNLFQIDYKDGSATLYFTPVKDQISGYQIIYGTKLHQEDFGIIFKNQSKEGVISYTINYLLPNTTYYFRVRPVNNCRFGLFSKTMKISTNASRTFYNDNNKNELSSSKNKKILVPTPVTTIYPEFKIIQENKNIKRNQFNVVKQEKITFKKYLEFLLNLLFVKLNELR